MNINEAGTPAPDWLEYLRQIGGLFRVPRTKAKETIDLPEDEFVKRMKGDIEKCKDWYPEEYKVFDLRKAVLSCQKTSLVYDIKLRKRFKFLIVRNTILLSIFVTTLCLLKICHGIRFYCMQFSLCCLFLFFQKKFTMNMKNQLNQPLI